jgi:hypothetical protein
MQAQAKPRSGTISGRDALAIRSVALVALMAVGVLVVAGCDTTDSADSPPEAVQGTDKTPPPGDPEPEKLDGGESREFEASDIEAAESASQEVQEYCSGAVSEAQYEGCLSHVTEDEIP